MVKVSFIVASYNYSQYIGETIESIIRQTYTNWELLVIDDGSKDSSIDVIASYCQKDKRIKLLTHYNNQNKGLIATLQLGIANATGEYIVFVESDDYITPNYLDKKLKLFQEHNNIGLIYNNIQFIGAKPNAKVQNIQNKNIAYWDNNNFPHNIIELIAFENYIPTFSCVMVRKDLLKNLNWNSPQPAWIDWWIWMEIVTKTNIYFSKEKLTYWRLHSNSYIHNSKTKFLENAKFHFLILIRYYDKFNNFPLKVKFINNKIVKSLYYLCSIITIKFKGV